MEIEEILSKISLALSYIIQNQDAFSDAQTLQIKELYPTWHIGVNYRKGQIARHNGNLYRCVQAHTSQGDWMPNKIQSLWTAISFTDDIENWKQPTGAHDAYNVGDIVIHNNLKWKSLINGNIWEPSDQSTLWTLST